jgi:hypothetical protein
LHGARSSQPAGSTGTTGAPIAGPAVFVDPGDDAVIVPMAGPSKKSLALAGAGIAVVSLLVGAVGAWRAVKASRPQTTTAPPLQSESSVALLETPHSLPHADQSSQPATGGGRGAGGRPTQGGGNGGGGGSGGSGSENPGNTNTGAARSGAGAGGNGGAGSPAQGGASATAGSGPSRTNGGSTASAGSTRPTEGNNNGAAAGSGGTTASAGNTASAGGSGSSGSSGSSAGSGSAGNTGGGSGEIGGSAGVEGTGMRGPRAPASGGFVEGDSTDATGTLSPSAFTFVYRHYRSQIASCHSSVTRGGQEVNGVLRLRVRIGTDGHVVRTRVLENSTRNEALATCVQNQVRSWRYPQPEGGEVEVDYPFGFGN